MSKRRPFLAVYAILIFFFLYIPLACISFFSFRGGPTWYFWYEKAFHDPALMDALKNSVLIGVGCTVLSTLLGTLSALALRHKIPFKETLISVLNLPLVLPEIVLGLSLLVWFAFLKITLGMLSVTLAHTTFALSYVTMLVLERAHAIDPMLEEAASDLGATSWQIFWKVTLPLLAPSILSAALLAFTLSFDDFLITFFTTGVGGDTLPLRLYSLMRFGISPEVNALSFMVILFTFLSALIILKLKDIKK